MNDYMVECNSSSCFHIYKRKRFLFIDYWSFMCEEVTFTAAKTLVDNLRLVNNE